MRFFRRKREREISEEIESHLRMATRDRVERGEPEEEARFAARREFGNIAYVQEQTRSVWTWNTIERLVQDVRFGVRILWKAPGLSATAVVLIALVIGGNTTIYSLIHALITKPAPGVTADRLVTLGTAGDRAEPFHSIPDYYDYAAQSQTVAPLMASGPERFTLTQDDGSYAFFGAYVTRNYFDGLGVVLARGRGFTADEDRLDVSGLVTIISHRVWQERFQGREDIVGHATTLNGFAATIVGVAPPLFLGPMLPSPEDFWVPMTSYFRLRGRERQLTDRSDPAADAFGVVMIGRLKPGVSIDEAKAELTALSSRLQSSYPETNKNKSVDVHPYAAAIFSGVWVMSSRFLAIFSVVTAITLIIVCANVANLLLARAIGRRRETAVRQSLGASRLRVIRMLIAEGVAISTVAWLVSCLIAYWVLLIIPKFMVPSPNALGMRPNHLNLDYRPDWQVLGYAMVLAIIGTLAFTIAPALRAWRQEVLPALKTGEAGVGQNRTRIANLLVVAQLAFSVLLLTSTGLAYRSLSLINSTDLGFDKENILLLTINPTLSITNRQVNLGLLESMQQRLGTVPGVSAVSTIRIPPPRVWSREPLRGSLSQEPVFGRLNFVGPDYLQVLGLRPVAGRDFSTTDRVLAPKSAVINQDLADVLWPGESAVGRTLWVGRNPVEYEVIGVAPNVLYTGVDSDPRPYFIFLAEHQDAAPPTGQSGLRGSGETTLYLKYSGSLDVLVPATAAALRELDGRIPIVSTRTLAAQMDSLTGDGALATMLLTLFSAISLVIASIGQYAVIVFDMKRRTREFGVRIAMGASPRQIRTSVLKQGLILTAIGLLGGFALSATAGFAMRRVLVGVTPTDLVTYLRVFSLLAVASLLACYLPARRASNVDPLIALRSE